jgi:hypothetical protein
MAKNAVQITFIVFLIVAFFVGAYVYAAIDLKQMIRKLEGMENREKEETLNEKKPEPLDETKCPDTLIRVGKLLYLFNTNEEEKAGENPRVFNNLDEYIKYLEEQKAEGKSCPVLFLQQETNTQGNDVYRARPSPLNEQPQLPLTSSLLKPGSNKPIKVVDASREGKYNQNMYAGFDPYGQYVGKRTDIDVLHDSTEKHEMSDNPMDVNWGGVLYTQSKIDAGEYKENEVTPTTYVTPKGGEVIPIPNPNIPPYPTQDKMMVPVRTH